MRPVQRLLVEAEVEDRVHHARHRELGAGADGDEERVLRRRRSPCPTAASTLLDRREDVVPEAGRELLAGGEVVVAGLGGDGEAGGDRQPGVGHLGEAGALAAEQVASSRRCPRPSAAPGVDVALGGRVRAVGQD